MTIPRFLRHPAILLVMASVVPSQSIGPGDAWQWIVKGPLNAPNGDEYFDHTLKDTVWSPTD